MDQHLAILNTGAESKLLIALRTAPRVVCHHQSVAVGQKHGWQ